MVWNPNDPWTKKDEKLDEALRQAKSQLRGLIPSGGVQSLLLAALAVFVAWQSAFIVAPDEEGVVKRFGTPVRTVGPGPHFKIPLAETVLQPKVEKLHRVEIGFRTDRQGRQQMVPQEALMLTGDMNILAIEFIVQYKIKEAQQYLFDVADIHDTIGKAAEASMREVIGNGTPRMPGFKHTYSADQIKSIISYLKTMPVPPPEAASEPAPRPTRARG